MSGTARLTNERALLEVARELRFVGLRRSGNHAVINWILRQTSGASHFVNDVSPCGFDERSLRALRGLSVPQELLLYSLEDQRLNYLTGSSGLERQKRGLFRSRERVDVLLLRDPFNLLASRLQHAELNDWPRIRTLRTQDLWIQHAKEFLGESCALQHSKIVMSYNRWATDQEYRRQLAPRLGLTFTDEGFLEVPEFGGGSSFDRTEYDRRAPEMAVLERWRHLQGDAAFRGCFEDGYVIDLARRIFHFDAALAAYVETELLPRTRTKARLGRRFRLGPLAQLVELRHRLRSRSAP